jgi:hypothetical protein
MVGRALIGKMGIELIIGRPEDAIPTARRALKQSDAIHSEKHLMGRLIPVDADLARRKRFACDMEVAAMLRILPSFPCYSQ